MQQHKAHYGMNITQITRERPQALKNYLCWNRKTRHENGNQKVEQNTRNITDALNTNPERETKQSRSITGTRWPFDRAIVGLRISTTVDAQRCPQNVRKWQRQ